MSTDVFNRKIPNLRAPITADKAIINWDGIISTQQNLSVAIQQPVNIRHAIGNNDALMHTGMPSGSFNIARIIAEGSAVDVFGKKGWDGCSAATITVTFNSGCGGSAAALASNAGGSVTYTLHGCMVNAYSFNTEAEGLTVSDNISMTFLTMSVE